MKSRLLFLLAVALLLMLASWVLTSSLSPSRRADTTGNGPAKLLSPKPIKSSSEASISQQEAWTKRLLLSSEDVNLAITNGLMIEITNRGPQAVEFWGYNSASPVYWIYIDGTNGLERLEIPTPSPIVRILLGPTQSLSFPVIPPLTDRPWHVQVSYNDYVPPPSIAALTRTPTRLERLAERIRAFVPLFRRSNPRFWFTMGESITPTNAPSSSVKPTQPNENLGHE